MILSDLDTTIDIQREKKLAAEKCLQYVRDGMCLGLGSGTTATVMLDILGSRIRNGLQVRGVPTSEVSNQLAQKAGIPLVGLGDAQTIDLTIDGADEVDENLNLIKGGGGALLREKIVASLSQRLVIIVDSRKRVERLGKCPLPVEVVRFAWQPIAARLGDLGASVVLRTDSRDRPFVTDEGNYILDCAFGQIDDPATLGRQLDAMPGIMEHGLFVDMTDTLIIGHGAETLVIER